MLQTFVEKHPSFTPVPHTLLQRQCACEAGAGFSSHSDSSRTRTAA